MLRVALPLWIGWLWIGWLWPLNSAAGAPPADRVPDPSVDRSPVDLVLTADESLLVAANQTAGTLSLVRLKDGQVLGEVPCGVRPTALALAAGDTRLLVTDRHDGRLRVFHLDGHTLKLHGSLWLGFEPWGVVAELDGPLAYVALTYADEVAVVDFEALRVVARIAVGSWPRYLALAPKRQRLAVGLNGDRSVAVVDTQSRQVLFTETLSGINLGQMCVSADEQFVYLPHMIYRQNPINPENIRKGWVLASRIARVRLDAAARREAISLDPQGKAVADPHGIALGGDGQWLLATAGGTHELLVYRHDALHFQSYSGPGDHIDPRLLNRPEVFDRIALGGRPLGLRVTADGRFALVANYLKNCIQQVDMAQRQVLREIPLGGAAEMSLARRGEAIFYDGQRSLDQWYSCHSCHFEGGTNAVTMDTNNDGSPRTFKTVLPLFHVTRTGPWFWHGWQDDLQAAARRSMMETMQAPPPKEEDVQALLAYLDTLRLPPNPHRTEDGRLSSAAQRGEQVFHSEKAGCAACHQSPWYTDGQVHDVGLGSSNDVYQGYNTPTLLGTYRKTRWLHRGQARTLESVLAEHHNPRDVTGLGELSEQELRDLVEYLKSL